VHDDGRRSRGGISERRTLREEHERPADGGRRNELRRSWIAITCCSSGTARRWSYRRIAGGYELALTQRAAALADLGDFWFVRSTATSSSRPGPRLAADRRRR
jgi:hypothetical protein